MYNTIHVKRIVGVLLLILFTFCTEDDPIQYTLTTQCTPVETGTVTPVSGLFEKGAEVELRASPIKEYIFKNWEGDAVGNENPLSIIMLDDKNITAVFEKVNYSLNIEIVGKGMVNQEIVLLKSSSTDYPSGTTVQLTAVPEEGWEFKAWFGDHQGSENPLTLTIDQAMNITCSFELDATYKTYVPDDNFEKALIDLGLDDAMDNYVKTENIEDVTSLDISGYNIASLEGLENFTSLLILDASNNKISEAHAFFGSSFGEGFNVGTINLSDNNISSLDISALHCLGSLDVRNNPLKCIQVNENHLACVQPSSLIQMIVKMDEGVTMSLDCGLLNEPKTLVPDENFEKALIDQGYDDIIDGYVYNYKIENVENLDVSNRQIQDMTGIEAFKNLKILNASNNNIVNIDLSHNLNLAVLNCQNNQLASLDVSANISLHSLDVVNNQLSCIQVVAFQLWGRSLNERSFIVNVSIDEGVGFSVDCSVSESDLTYVPDDAFEQALIDLGLDDVLDDYVKTISIINVVELDLSGKNISDLTGMEDFQATKNIDVSNNNLSTVDISDWFFLNLDLRNNSLTCIQANESQINSQGGGFTFIWIDDKANLSLDCGY